MDWNVVIVAAHFAVLICSLEWNCNSDSELAHFVGSLLAMILWSCPQCTVQCLHNIDCNLVALSSSEVANTHHVSPPTCQQSTELLWNVENTGEEMFGKKGIKRFFFSWQKTDHDEVLQEKTGDSDQVKGNFLIRLLSWLFIPWLLPLPVHTLHTSADTLMLLDSSLSLPCQDNEIYYSLGDKSVIEVVNWGPLTPSTQCSVSNQVWNLGTLRPSENLFIKMSN